MNAQIKMRLHRLKSGFTLVELLIVIGIFLIMFTFLAPEVRMTKERAHKVNCANNLRLISLGLHLYASEHNEEFPPNLGALYPNYVKDESAFDCPAINIVARPEKPDYNYVVGLTESSPQDQVIAHDLDGNHKRGGKNILRINGSVEWSTSLR